jgi:hypothetical protein
MGSVGGWFAQPVAALISKADSQIDLVVTSFETIPKIEAQQWQHDLP